MIDDPLPGSLPGFISLIGLICIGSGVVWLFGWPALLIYIGLLLVAFAHVLQS